MVTESGSLVSLFSFLGPRLRRLPFHGLTIWFLGLNAFNEFSLGEPSICIQIHSADYSNYILIGGNMTMFLKEHLEIFLVNIPIVPVIN
jgi:hypothetical protein